MSRRQRGQEVTIRVAVDGQVQPGSFFKVQDFTVTVRDDITEEDYLGETATDLDYQHHGFDLAFSIHQQDRRAIDFLSTIIDRELNHQAHPDITITVIHDFREAGERPAVEVYHQVFLRVNEHGFGGRKEYVSVGFEGKCKTRSVLSA